MNSADSSTGRTGRSGWSRSLRRWPPCSVPTSRPTAPHPTGGCSAEPAAGRSANRSTAVPGTPPALSPSGRASRQRARPAPLRPASRRPVAVAERRRGPRPDRRPGRAQRRSPAHHVQPLHPRPRRPPQPEDRQRPRALRKTRSVPVRGKASGYTDRTTATDAVRYASVDSPPGPATARGSRRYQPDTPRNSNLCDSHLS